MQASCRLLRSDDGDPRLNFAYLLEKIRTAPISREPFAHVAIDDFFDADDFAALAAAPEIALDPQRNDDDLFASLFAAGYAIIDFPGCSTDKNAYVKWHREKARNPALHNSSCEGFGVTLRLAQASSPIVSDVVDFMNGSDFREALAAKFDVDLGAVFYDAGIQKYLDGYEISPHPDIRRKALTYMVNVNPGTGSEREEHHTHYLRLRDAYSYVGSYWAGHPGQDRGWIPWSWCESRKIQAANNSIVIFSPDNDTLHGVKAAYDHLRYQRTQLYGNLWYHATAAERAPSWEQLVIRNDEPAVKRSLRAVAASIVPEPLKRFAKAKLGDPGAVPSNRLAQRERDWLALHPN
jgi:hypothetical protein